MTKKNTSNQNDDFQDQADLYELELDMEADFQILEQHLDDLNINTTDLESKIEQLQQMQGDEFFTLKERFNSDLIQTKNEIEQFSNDVASFKKRLTDFQKTRAEKIDALILTSTEAREDIRKMNLEHNLDLLQKKMSSIQSNAKQSKPQLSDKNSSLKKSRSTNRKKPIKKEPKLNPHRTGGYISSISIENFKGIGEKITIPLKPITLMFGANSAGKSTILQAMMTVRSFLEKGHWEPSINCCGGELNVGEFYHAVHNHDTSKTIVLELQYELNDDGFLTDEINADFPITELMDVKNCTLRASINHENNCPEFSILIDQTLFATIRIYEEEFFYFSSDGNHPLWLAAEKYLDAKLHNFLISDSSIIENRKYGEFNFCLRENNTISDCSFPISGKWTLDYFASVDEDSQFRSENQDLVHKGESFLEQTILGPLRLIYNELEKFRYVGPIRKTPPPSMNLDQIKENSWFNGLAAWSNMHYIIDKDLKEKQDKLDWFEYTVEQQGRAEFTIPSKFWDGLRNNDLSEEEKGSVLLESLKTVYGEDWDFRAMRETLILKHKKTGVFVEPSAVGVGISQVFPVIMATMLRSAQFVAIEQPELHLHPSIQCDLGDLFISQMHRYPERTFLLETHSEHLILRLLRRIRETAAHELDDPSLALTPNDVGVLYVDASEKGVRITELPIDEDGDFTRKWPKGFFDERAEELF